MGSLLEAVMDTHGGVERWSGLETVAARLAFGGLAFSARFNSAGLRERRIEVSTRRPRVVFYDFPGPGRCGVFTPDRVWVEVLSGKQEAARCAPRAAFRSWRRAVWWDTLDLLYFAGYALWNYFTAPFLLAREGVVAEEVEPWAEGDEVWRRLAVRFPEALPTHCREQVFYFDRRYRLRRHDYDPEVFASWARAAHYCSGHASYAGFLFPTRRRVLPRMPDGYARTWPTLVWAEVEDIWVG